MSRKWNDTQRAMLRPDSIPLAENMWCYEEPDGLSVYGGTVHEHNPHHIATIKRSSIEAYLRRVREARKEGE